MKLTFPKAHPGLPRAKTLWKRPLGDDLIRLHPL
jgi:hypothetical protein